MTENVPKYTFDLLKHTSFAVKYSQYENSDCEDILDQTTEDIWWSGTEVVSKGVLIGFIFRTAYYFSE